jgi:hypothetical protein
MGSKLKSLERALVQSRLVINLGQFEMLAKTEVLKKAGASRIGFDVGRIATRLK